MSQYRLMRHLVAVAALGAFGTVGCFVVDDKEGDDEGAGGESGEESGGSGGSATGGKGGSSTGGKGGSSSGGKGGSSSGGSSTGGVAPTGGTSGTGPGVGAVMKFCNELYKTAADGTQTEADLTLTFNGVEATALSGTCTPVVPAACIPIAAVTGPDVSLTDPSDGTVVVEGPIPTLVVADGEEILVLGTVDDVELAPTITAGQFLEAYACADTDPFAEVLETRSTPFRLPAERNLRAQQNPAATRWMKKAVTAPGIGR